MTILVDMDDVMEDLLVSWVMWLNKKHGTSVDYNDVNDWNVRKFFPELTKEEVFAPLSDEHFWDTVQPKYMANSSLQALRDIGHKVYIVTTSYYNTIIPKMEKVLFRYFPFITWDDVIITSKKQMVRGDILIDDNPQNLIGGEYFGILMDMPHNLLFDEREYGIVRAYDWHDVMNIIRAIDARQKSKTEVFL